MWVQVSRRRDDKQGKQVKEAARKDNTMMAALRKNRTRSCLHFERQEIKESACKQRHEKTTGRQSLDMQR
jgi:hypothetical protein